MRKALNDNPLVQIGLLAVLGILVAVVFISSMGGRNSAGSEDTASAETAAGDATATTAGAAPAVPAAGEVTAAPEAVAPAPPAGGTPFEASKGLPAEVVDAYESGNVVVLLVVQKNGIEDKSLREDVQALESDGGTSVFVTDVKNIAKYSRIAEGTNLDRVPAIIVLHPLRGNAGGESTSLPQASVSYGYRGPESVRQTVKDARYDGKQLAYDPG